MCSNPNCRKFFSRPKIIRYQVCPACQTIVNIAESPTQGEVPISFISRKPEKLDKQEMVEANKPKGLTFEPQPSGVAPSLEKLTVSEKKPEVSQEAVSPKQSQLPKQEVEKPRVQETKALEVTTVSQSSPDCQYFFGYLGQRKKGEEIPNQCIECAKSLNCMLSSYYAKEESVEEIKKWYAPLISR